MSSSIGSTGSVKYDAPLRLMTCLTRARHFFSAGVVGPPLDDDPALSRRVQKAVDLRAGSVQMM
jgi:hypothetical protein